MWMRDKLLLPLACVVFVMAIGTAVLIHNTDEFNACGVEGNKIWYFTDNGTYVEYWGNMSDDNWSAIIADRNSMQAYVESEIERYNAAVRDSGRYEITLVTKE